jgi:hypothetical protein
MPLFNWNAQGAESVTNRRLWIYWVISVSLTLLTVLGWWFWTRSKAAREQQEDVAALASIDKLKGGVRAQFENFRYEKKGAGVVSVPQSRTSTTFGDFLQKRGASKAGGKGSQPGVEVYASVGEKSRYYRPTCVRPKL